eukprot:GHRR01003577.1.p2 GENE.GHRR01003577.1~~GHRR01003577.1.p2  ORF type:complete len:315 (+),score=139.22 GHRR01003577.1:2499-3443(+)
MAASSGTCCQKMQQHTGFGSTSGAGSEALAAQEDGATTAAPSRMSVDSSLCAASTATHSTASNLEPAATSAMAAVVDAAAAAVPVHSANSGPSLAAAAAAAAVGAGAAKGFPMSPPRTNFYGLPQIPYGGPADIVFEGVMQNVLSQGLWRARFKFQYSRGQSGAHGSSSSVAYCSSSTIGRGALQQAALALQSKLVKADMAWWLADKPETVLKFIRRTCDMSNDFDMWGSGFNSWQDMLWRRSALQYLMDMQLGPEAGVCFSVMERLAREVDRLDNCMRSVDAEASDLTIKPPAGLPSSHWWYSLKGQISSHVC